MTRPAAAALGLSTLALFSLVRLALVPALDLMPQSAYYFTAYAEHLSLSYFDHPPMIGWLLWLAGAVGGKHELSVLLAIFVVTVATQLAVYRLGRELLGDPGGGRALALLAAGGVATLLSLVAVPDVPLLLFWALALLALRRALGLARDDARGEPGAEPAAEPAADAVDPGRPGEPPRRGAWAASGLAMGLAFLSKYTAVFLPAGLLLFLLASPRHRARLASFGGWAGPALAALVALVVSLPVWIWNAGHGWASFLFQAGERTSGRAFDPAALFGFLGSQALVVLPIPFFLFLIVAGRELTRLARRRGPGRGPAAPRGAPLGPPSREITLFLLAFSLPLVLTCLGLSTVTWVKVNWAMPAYLTGTILAATAIGRRGLRWHLASALVLHALLAVQVVLYPATLTSDDTWLGWDELADRVALRHADFAAAHPGAFVFSADSYKTTAELRFYSEAPVYGMNVLGWNALHYGFLNEDLAALAGRDALLVRSEDRLRPSEKTERYLARTREHFREVREVESIEIRRDGRLIRLFRVFECLDYRGPGEPARWYDRPP